MNYAYLSHSKFILGSMFILSLMLFSMQSGFSTLTLNSVVFDPTIITSGDNVDVYIQYSPVMIGSTQSKEISNSAYTFVTKLVADDDITQQYVSITRSVGEQVAKTIVGNQIYVEKFQVKVSQQAPTGTYHLRLIGQWFKNNQSLSQNSSIVIEMNVKKQGIVLSVANIQTNPSKIRSGDSNVELAIQLTNSGEKIAKNVEFKLHSLQGITSAVANSNRVNVGTIKPNTQTVANIVLDFDKLLLAGEKNIPYTITYEDTDANMYVVNGSFPLYINKRPYLVVENVSGQGLTKTTSYLTVTVKNIGQDTADSADIRLVKQSSQPFELDVRTQYLGQLKPQETATVIFPVDVLAEASHTTHKFTVQLRAKGNANDGDESIYTFTDAVWLPVVGDKPNYYPSIALVGAVIVGLFLAIRSIMKKQKR
jgi:hypothetical protein